MKKNGIDLLEEKNINILYVGLGTAGTAEIEMAKKNPQSHIIATTIDEKGIKNTRKIIQESCLEERIELKIEDISEKLDYEDETFDYVYARLVLHYKEFLEKARFVVKHIKTYEECLSIDYDRKNMNQKASELIEVLAIK